METSAEKHHRRVQDHDPDRYVPDFDEYGQDINCPLDDEETAAPHRLDTGQGWITGEAGPGHGRERHR